MLSKMSYLNKSIIKSDLKRFWYLAVLNTLVTFFSGTFLVMDRFLYGRQNPQRLTNLPGDFYFAMIFGMIFALLTTVAVFSYLNKSNQAAFCHAFPIKRKCHYLSHLTSVVILISASGILNSLALFFYTLNHNVAKSFTPDIAIKFFVVYMTYSLLVMSLTAFTQMLTGLSSACVVLTACFVAIPFAFETFIKSFLQTHVYGYFGESEYLTGKIFYLSFEKILSVRILIYLALILVFLLLGYILYKFRKIECNGEVVAYIKMRPVFIYTVALFTGMASYAYFGGFYGANIFFMLPFGILGIIIAYMLSRKSFNLIGVHKPLIIYTLFVIAVFLVVKLDLSGFERRMPDIENISSVEFPSMSHYDKAGFYPEEKRTDYAIEYFLCDDVFDGKFTEYEDIENILKLHSYKIEIRDKNQGPSLRIKYNLKNGKTMERRYNIDVYQDKEYLEDIYNSQKMRGILFELANGTKKELVGLEVFDDRLNYAFAYYQGAGNLEAEKIKDALIKDLLETPYDELPEIYHHEGLFPTSITMSLKVDGHYQNEEFEETTATKRLSYTIYPTYKNTWKVLEELNLTSKLPTSDDVLEIGVNINDFNTSWDNKVVTYEESAYIEDYKYMYKITDKETIKEIYEWALSDKVIYPEFAEGHKNVDLYIVFKNGYFLNHSFIFDETIWPEPLKNLN